MFIPFIWYECFCTRSQIQTILIQQELLIQCPKCDGKTVKIYKNLARKYKKHESINDICAHCKKEDYQFIWKVRFVKYDQIIFF